MHKTYAAVKQLTLQSFQAAQMLPGDLASNYRHVHKGSQALRAMQQRTHKAIQKKSLENHLSKWQHRVGFEPLTLTLTVMLLPTNPIVHFILKLGEK